MRLAQHDTAELICLLGFFGTVRHCHDNFKVNLPAGICCCFQIKNKKFQGKMCSDGFFHIDSIERFQSRFQQLYKYRSFYSCGRSILAFE